MRARAKKCAGPSVRGKTEGRRRRCWWRCRGGVRVQTTEIRVQRLGAKTGEAADEEASRRRRRLADRVPLICEMDGRRWGPKKPAGETPPGVARKRSRGGGGRG